MNLFRFIYFFYPFFILFSPYICFSQQNNIYKQGDIFQSTNNKIDSLLENDFLLMNARFFNFKYPHSKGNPYFETSNNSRSRILLEKKEYDNVRIMYDIWEQKLGFIVESTDKNGLILELNNQVITRFYLDGKVFVNHSKLQLLPQTGFYEEIFSGNHIKVYARWSKTLTNISSDNYSCEFSIQKRSLFFEINKKRVDVTSKNNFTKIFTENRKKIKTYIRKNRISFAKSKNDDLVRLFEYVDNLK